MRNPRIIAGIIVGIALATSFAGGYAVDAIIEAQTRSQAKSTCGDQLRQAMDDMHEQMLAVMSSDNVDEDFVRLMLPHHQAAIEMAKVELLCGKDGVNRRLAQEIIVDQQSEIDLMRLWLSKHDSEKPASNPRAK